MLAERVHDIERRVSAACERAGRARCDVDIVAVTKTLPAVTVNEAIALGLDRIGENRVQEYLAKRPELLPHRFHLIGHLQRNKVRSILEHCALIHSVDSARLAGEISRVAVAQGRTAELLLEVNTSGEASKEGVEPGDAQALAERILELPALRLRGFMTVAAPAEDAEELRPSFRMLRGLRDETARLHPELGPLHCSMGMSGDFEVAVEEGATLIRLGTALFGARCA